MYMKHLQTLSLTLLMIAAAFSGCTHSNSGTIDGDGVPDSIDQCPNTPPGVPVDSNGCQVACTTNPKLTANDAQSLDRFGTSVALYANTAIVGSFRDDDAGSSIATESGSAYIFVCDGITWTQEAKLVANDAEPGDLFGISVDIYGDTAIVGSVLDDDQGSDSGSVYIFIRSGTTWTQQAKLTASDGAGLDYFGQSVAIDGDTVVVGADGDDGFITWASTVQNAGCHAGLAFYTLPTGPPCAIGTAYIFTRSGTTWVEEAKLTASDSSAPQTGDDRFGFDVAIHRNTVVIGSPWDAETNIPTCTYDPCPYNAGAAYVFTRSNTIDPSTGYHIWVEEAKLTASDQPYLMGHTPSNGG